MTEERSAEHVQLKQLNGGEDKNIAATENTSEETRLHRDSGHSSSSVAGSETAASAAHSAPETVNKAVVATEGTARTPTGSGKSIADITPTEKEQADVTDSPALVACRIALSKAEKNYSTSEIELGGDFAPMLEQAVDSFLHLAAVIEPPIVAFFATPFAGDLLGKDWQLPFETALVAALAPLALLGAWTWIRSRMMARVTNAQWLVNGDCRDLHLALVSLQSIKDAAAAADNNEILKLADTGILDVKACLERSEWAASSYGKRFAAWSGFKFF